MDRFGEIVELAANIAIVIVAVLLCAVLLKNQFATTTTKDLGGGLVREVKPGEKINLAEVDWRKREQTLLLVLPPPAAIALKALISINSSSKNGAAIHVSLPHCHKTLTRVGII